jgi:hypothetical protein
MNDFDKSRILGDCGGEYFGSHKAIDEKDVKPTITIEDLLQKNDFEKLVGSFELPESIKNIMTVDEVNASVDWYLKWKVASPIAEQNTCTIKKLFGYNDGLKVIIAINFYKYLRNKGYDPEVVELFLSRPINKNN